MVRWLKALNTEILGQMATVELIRDYVIVDDFVQIHFRSWLKVDIYFRIDVSRLEIAT